MGTPVRAASVVASVLALAACSSSTGNGSTGAPDGGALGADASDASEGGTTNDASGVDGPSEASVEAGEAGSADGSTSPDASAPVPPGPAAGAGFTHLVFDDDFTTADTIAPTQGAASGYKWYWSFDGNASLWSVQTTASAGSIHNGNTSGGTNASPKGGILTLTGPGEPNDALITVPGSALNNASAMLPTEGDGCWAHAYFEAYIQFQIDGTGSSNASTGWPAFWSWSAQGLHGYGFGGSSLNAANYSEIDFMETYGTIFNNQPGNWTATMHQWPANMASDGNINHTDNEWHTYGCLWISTGTGTGQVQFFYDGAQVDKTVPTGTNQTQFSLEGMYQFIVLGTGKGWPMNVDWVRVWQ